jgi:hypothetical protein
MVWPIPRDKTAAQTAIFLNIQKAPEKVDIKTPKSLAASNPHAYRVIAEDKWFCVAQMTRQEA